MDEMRKIGMPVEQALEFARKQCSAIDDTNFIGTELGGKLQSLLQGMLMVYGLGNTSVARCRRTIQRVHGGHTRT
jgi:hypothetical protein